MGMAAEATAASPMKGGSAGAEKVAREAATARATERRSVGAKKAPEAITTAAAPDAGAGRRVFLTTCTKCHTLGRGDWRGDKLSLADLRPSYSTTRDKVTNGGVAMPAFKRKLSEQEIRDVAAFVAKVTARGSR
jgi:cytochrome c6